MKENRRNRFKHIAASIVLLFCMVMSIGMICFADEQGTVIVESARIRAAADQNSEQLGSVAKGKTVDIIGQTTGTDKQVWYQVYVDANTKGYIRANLIKLKDGASLKTVDGGASSAGTDTAAPPATATDAKKAVVINKANIRKEASADSELVGTQNRGTVLTIKGETTGSDKMKWYQVSFTYQEKEVTGYVRSDLVTFENVPSDPASSEINGEVNPDEPQPEETAPEPEPQPDEQPEPAPQPSTFQPINVEEEPPYVMQGFKEFKFTLPNDGQEYKGYQNEAGYIICYAQMPTGEQGWALVNISMGICQPYVYAMEGIDIPTRVPGGLVSVIVLVVIIIILVAVIGLLLLKSREHSVTYKGYDDDDEDSEDDIEDLEEMEEEPQPIRRPQSAGPQPVRRPQPGAGPQPMRRPQPGPSGVAMPQGGQPMRHPQSGAGPQPMRRPQPGPAPQEPQPARRPQPGAGPSGSGARPQPGQGPQPARRPQGSPQPARRPQPGAGPQPVQGYKAKNLLEDEDMDFMDIE